MGSHSHHHGWHRFKHKFGGYFLFACVLAAILGGVVLIMLMLTSANWRARP